MTLWCKLFHGRYRHCMGVTPWGAVWSKCTLCEDRALARFDARAVAATADLAFSDDVDPASRDPLPLEKLLKQAQDRLRPVR
jgi:hypothetical protein